MRRAFEPCHESCMICGCITFHQLGPHWSPISCALPLSRSGLGPSRAEVGFGSRLVGCVRRFCRPPPPLVGFLARRPSAFSFFLALSGFARLGPGVLVLVFSPFPFPFCVPPLVFWLSNCHLIFIVISFSSFLHLHLHHLHLIRQGLKRAPRQRGKCETSE